jgi:hypothetical protein
LFDIPLSKCEYNGVVNRWSTRLMKFESKTKQDYEWRQTLIAQAKNFECDVHDMSTWCNATISKVKK